MTAVSTYIFATVFYVLPLVLLLVAVLAVEANLLLVLALLTWMGIGVFLGAATMAEGHT